MPRRATTLALTTAAAIYLALRDAAPHDLVWSLAVGALLCGLVDLWRDYFYDRGRTTGRSLSGGSLLKGEDRVE